MHNLQKTFFNPLFLFCLLGEKMVYNGWILRKLHRGQEKNKVLWGKERIMESSGLSAQNLFDKWTILQTLWNIKYIKGQ